MQKVTHLITIVMMAGMALFAVSCSGESDSNSCNVDEEPWQECSCDEEGLVGYQDCELVDEPESKDYEWGECTCAARFARVCNITAWGPADGLVEGVCTVTLQSGDETYVFKDVATNTCDSPQGAHCLPMPAGSDIQIALMCAAQDDPSLILENTVFDFEFLEANSSEDHMLLIAPGGTNAVIDPFVFPTQDPNNEDVTAVIDKCEDFYLDPEIWYI